MANNNIIKIDFKVTSLPLEIKEKKNFLCRHLLVLLNQDSRSLKCRDCGAAVEPFDYLYEAATGDRNLLSTRDALEYEIKNLREKLEELKRLERNIKSRIRTARRKL